MKGFMGGICLVPVDDRPCCSVFPERVAAIAGIPFRSIPSELTGQGPAGGDPQSCSDWLERNLKRNELLIWCAQLGCFGGLVRSRLDGIGLREALQPLRRLHSLRKEHRKTLWFATGSITRSIGKESSKTMNDPIRRRNMAVNQSLVDMVAEESFDALILARDDCAPNSASQDEACELLAHAEERGVSDRVFTYCGTDESAMLLVARFIGLSHLRPPSVHIEYFPEECSAATPLFHDEPLHKTIEQMVAAVGCQTAADGPLLAVAGPPEKFDCFAESEGGFLVVPDDTPDRVASREQLVERLRQLPPHLAAIADVSFANGADLHLGSDLNDSHLLPQLAGYAAWNTAGNSLGTALAALIALNYGPKPDPAAARRFVLERLLDDLWYQVVLRPIAMQKPDRLGELTDEFRNFLTDRARRYLAYHETPGPGVSARINWPWERPFEAHVEVEFPE